MRQIIVGKELRSVRDAGQGDGESPVLLIGNEEEVALPFGEFERLRPHGGLAFGLIGEITNNVHLVVKHGSAGRVANDESHRLDAVFKVGTGVDRAGHASNTYGSRHIHRPRCLGLFRSDKLLASCCESQEHSEARCESGAV